METRTLGKSGVSVSRVGLGGFELGPEVGEEPDVDRAVGVIEAALDAGINWLDTSENYLDTRNESLIGAALRRIPRGCPRRDEGCACSRNNGWRNRLPSRSDPRRLPGESAPARTRPDRRLLLALAR